MHWLVRAAASLVLAAYVAKRVACSRGAGRHRLRGGEPQGSDGRAGETISKRSTGNKVIVSYGASNALAKQIEAAAPADLFISADLDWMDYVGQRNLLAPGHALQSAAQHARPDRARVQQDRAQDRAGLRSRRGARHGEARDGQPRQRARGQVRQERAREAWASGRASKDRSRARRTCAPRSRWFRDGEAPFGIVYATDALADKGVKVVDTFPPDSYPPIVYPAALLATSKSAAAKPLLRLPAFGAARVLSGKSTDSGLRNEPCSDLARTKSAS